LGGGKNTRLGFVWKKEKRELRKKPGGGGTRAKTIFDPKVIIHRKKGIRSNGFIRKTGKAGVEKVKGNAFGRQSKLNRQVEGILSSKKIEGEKMLGGGAG